MYNLLTSRVNFLVNLLIMENELSEKRQKYRVAFGNTVKKMRKRRSLIQQKLASLLNVEGATVSRYESGTIDIPSSLLPIVSEVCGSSFDEYGKNIVDFSLDTLYWNYGTLSQKGAVCPIKEYPIEEWDEKRLNAELKKTESEIKTILCKETFGELRTAIKILDDISKLSESGYLVSLDVGYRLKIAQKNIGQTILDHPLYIESLRPLVKKQRGILMAIDFIHYLHGDYGENIDKTNLPAAISQDDLI